ncbi:MAG: polyprenyl synthetase family protein [Acidimicrobiia bacterium]|nr:polyprenyl synthetase family protein [Acidimicrobiia bacterium]
MHGGKRLRAALLLDCARQVGGTTTSSDVVTAAATIELLHLGTLIHDDVMDASLTRRGVPTVNAMQGDSVAGYVGLWTLSAAMAAMEQLPEYIYGRAEETLKAMCDGQFAEAMALGNADRSVDEYLTAIEGKTGSLFGLSSYVGARLCCDDIGHAEQGLSAATALGVAYQIVDDVFDLDPKGTESRGKPAGADVRAGVITLPVLLARDRDDSVGDLLTAVGKDPELATSILAVVRRTHADVSALEVAEAIIADALTDADASPLRPALSRFASSIRAHIEVGLQWE